MGVRRNPIPTGSASPCLPGALLLRTIPTPTLLPLAPGKTHHPLPTLLLVWDWPCLTGPLVSSPPPRDAEPHSHSASSLPSGSAAGCPGRPCSAGGAWWSSWRWAGPPPCRTASSPTPTGSRSFPGARGGNCVGAGHRHRGAWVFLKKSKSRWRSERLQHVSTAGCSCRGEGNRASALLQTHVLLLGCRTVLV